LGASTTQIPSKCGLKALARHAQNHLKTMPQSIEFKEKTWFLTTKLLHHQCRFFELHTTKTQDTAARQSFLNRLEFTPLVHLSALSGKC
jgi:hypothetical protein